MLGLHARRDRGPARIKVGRVGDESIGREMQDLACPVDHQPVGFAVPLDTDRRAGQRLGTWRKPEAGARIQGMMIIGLALIETLVIYVLLICFVWGGKITG